MEKEAHAEVNHYKASPSQRSQLSQSTRFRLVIENSVSRTIYKKETVETEDGGGHIKVVMYDGGNPIASDHRLASVRVELVVIEGGFDEKRDSWSKEEFEESIIKPRRTTTLTSLVKNGTFNLIGGSCDHEGAIIMDNSQQREVKLGVRITVPTETRVLEGVSNPFKVQEGKTKKPAPNKTGKKPSPPVPTRNLVHPTSTHATQHGQGPVSPYFLFSKSVSPDEQHGLPSPVIQGVLQKTDHGEHTEFLTDGTAEDNRPATVPLMVEGNGQALNGNGQQSCQQFRTQISCLPTSTRSMQNDQDYNRPSTSIQNPLQARAYCLVNQRLLACEQDQYTTRIPDASSQLAFQDLSAYASMNGTYQWNSITRGEISVEGVQPSNVQLPVQDYWAKKLAKRIKEEVNWSKVPFSARAHMSSDFAGDLTEMGTFSDNEAS